MLIFKKKIFLILYPQTLNSITCTLVNSLFLSDLYADRKIHPVDERLKKTVEIQKTTMEIEEKGVKLRLTIVDTPGIIFQSLNYLHKPV